MFLEQSQVDEFIANYAYKANAKVSITPTVTEHTLILFLYTAGMQ